ncbi:hypothetical protein RB628_33140 [Streptomyces sp. ADMS]|uniref:hypothetical protein n=1 Tax=Streptomyces sp. ADMS TaxID=3071415 RepID=UPI00296E97D2|nr:hypothetical protein [Streptomyces sp. ADMS]MDW4910046.1 hypothetical protein [Streptomyces sp. ADMS]
MPHPVRERDSGRVRITRGGRRLLNARHHLYDAAAAPKPLTAADWQDQLEGWGNDWSARRMFLTADGEAGAPFGNYTITIDPADGSCTARRREDGPRQTPATTATRRAEAAAVRPADRTGTTAPAAPSHHTPGRTERTAPARTSRGTLVVRQTRARPPGKHPPHGPTTVRGPSIHDQQLTLFGMPEMTNTGQ